MLWIKISGLMVCAARDVVTSRPVHLAARRLTSPSYPVAQMCHWQQVPPVHRQGNDMTPVFHPETSGASGHLVSARLTIGHVSFGRCSAASMILSVDAETHRFADGRFLQPAKIIPGAKA